LANSSLVSDLKNAIIKEITHDEALFYAIDSPNVKSIDDADELVYSHIFPYNKNPETITEVITFLTIQVHIPKTYDRSNTWVTPRLEIWILSHDDHMKVNNIPKVKDNRNDYISKLLDKKFNGRDTFGTSSKTENNVHLYGKLELVSNVEGAFSKNFLYRQMIFEMKDLNASLCDDE
jgi:hypothetical protein